MLDYLREVHGIDRLNSELSVETAINKLNNTSYDMRHRCFGVGFSSIDYNIIFDKNKMYYTYSMFANKDGEDEYILTIKYVGINSNSRQGWYKTEQMVFDKEGLQTETRVVYKTNFSGGREGYTLKRDKDDSSKLTYRFYPENAVYTRGDDNRVKFDENCEGITESEIDIKDLSDLMKDYNYEDPLLEITKTDSQMIPCIPLSRIEQLDKIKKAPTKLEMGIKAARQVMKSTNIGKFINTVGGNLKIPFWGDR